MNLDFFKKDLTLLSILMIIINVFGIFYQLLHYTTIYPIIIKIAFIFLYAIFITCLLSKAKDEFVIGIIIAFVTLIVSCIYLDIISMLIALIVAVECIKINDMKRPRNT